MAEFDELKITSGQSLNAMDWNGLVEKIDNLKLDIAPNLSRSTLTLSIDNPESKRWISLSADPSSNILKVQTEHGYLNMGSRDPDWTRFETDIAKFHFNKEVKVDGHIHTTKGFKFPDDTIQTSAVKFQSGTYKMPGSIPVGGIMGMAVVSHKSPDIKLTGFAEEPHIICSIQELSVTGNKPHIKITVIDKTKSQFKINIGTSEFHSKIDKLVVQWLAIGK